MTAREYVRARGWKVKDLAKRWEVGERQMYNILKENSQRTIDAAKGLPTVKEVTVDSIGSLTPVEYMRQQESLGNKVNFIIGDNDV